jgi:hypothetical protein
MGSHNTSGGYYRSLMYIRLRTGSAGELVKSMVHARGPRRKRASGC